MGFPPCENPLKCQDSPCCTQGKKYEWPELLGKPGTLAKSIIERENPELTAVIETVRLKILLISILIFVAIVLLYLSPMVLWTFHTLVLDEQIISALL
ncbi:hypothetical protein BVRB_4g078460 [Beta vulgaris subsp. vulgaris]|nr:hypothetical protein BVRB_4g078460 [Beta vulgaris subsp. vulgaris]